MHEQHLVQGALEPPLAPGLWARVARARGAQWTEDRLVQAGDVCGQELRLTKLRHWTRHGRGRGRDVRTIGEERLTGCHASKETTWKVHEMQSC